jgi:hypothetical protein
MRFEGLIVIGLLFTPLGGTVLYAIWDERPFAKLSPIAANLPSNPEEANCEFARRVYSQFPVGSPESDLVRALAAQGFEQPRIRASLRRIDAADSKPAGSGFMALTGSGLNPLCASSWIVGWDVDEKRQITRINARHDSACMY